MEIREYVEKVNEAAKYIRERISEDPKIAMILGSGLGGISREIDVEKSLLYTDIPYFPLSTAPGHKGELVFGKVHGKPVVLMNGRFHYYEGYSMKEITFPVRVFQLLGVEIFIVTNAAGGINPDFEVGKPMVITDHINLLGDNPLIGPNVDEWGPRFPDLSNAYDRGLREMAVEIAGELGIKIYEGVYVAVPGPNFETAAEYRMLRRIGADAVGMSTVPEVIVANHGGMKVLGFSAITDKGDPDNLKPLTAEEVLENAERAGKAIARIISEVINRL